MSINLPNGQNQLPRLLDLTLSRLSGRRRVTRSPLDALAPQSIRRVNGSPSRRPGDRWTESGHQGLLDDFIRTQEFHN